MLFRSGVMEIQAPMDFYDGEGNLLHSFSDFKSSSSFQFCNDSSEVVFMINKDGCHVPDGVSADEAAQVVIERLNDHIKNLVKPLEKENAQLKANIADGIRVYAHQEFDDAWWCNTNVPVFNATLLLDKGE